MALPSNSDLGVPRDQPDGPGAATVPWTLRDSWIGIALILPALLIALASVELVPDDRLKGAVSLTLFELAILLPVAIILVWRRASWSQIGFRSFEVSSIGLGCGALTLTYLATIIHNSVLVKLGIPTQAESVLQLLELTGSSLGLAVGGVIVGPVVEEVVFRGFFYQGLRRAYGTRKALLVSAVVFGVMHLQLEALIPTFLLGCALTYLYERARSIWPGILLHLVVNLIGIGVVIAATRMPGIL